MEIHFWKYTLTASHMLNARHSSEVNGALLRINDGYSCLQPWESLGHQSLSIHLTDLQNQNPTLPLNHIALQCAAIDAAARSEKKSLFENLHIPDSHATLLHPDHLSLALAHGFTTAKLKNLPNDHPFHSAIKLRLDFNSAYSQQSFSQWAANLSSEKKSRIEFIEDPFPYDQKSWSEEQKLHGIPFAYDQTTPTSHPFIHIWKPAWTQERPSPNAIVTSAMDHPLGQAWAAYCAASSTTLCGLRTDHLWEKNSFSEQLGTWSPRWNPPPGTGLGFDELLEKLPWKKLC